MPRGIAQIKAKSRHALHKRMAVSAFYEDHALPEPVELTARWHTKLSLAGKAEDGFDATIVEGINRLVFQSVELTSAGRAERDLAPLPDGVDSFELQKGGKVTLPDIGLSFELDHEEEPDGPLNIYWGVVQL